MSRRSGLCRTSVVGRVCEEVRGGKDNRRFWVTMMAVVPEWRLDLSPSARNVDSQSRAIEGTFAASPYTPSYYATSRDHTQQLLRRSFIQLSPRQISLSASYTHTRSSLRRPSPRLQNIHRWSSVDIIRAYSRWGRWGSIRRTRRQGISACLGMAEGMCHTRAWLIAGSNASEASPA